MSICHVTLVHPAKAVGQNEMLFGRDSCVVPCNILLDGPQFPDGKGRSVSQNPQFAATLPIAKLLWPLLVSDCHYCHCWTVLDYQSHDQTFFNFSSVSVIFSFCALTKLAAICQFSTWILYCIVTYHTWIVIFALQTLRPEASLIYSRVGSFLTGPTAFKAEDRFSVLACLATLQDTLNPRVTVRTQVRSVP